MKNIKLWSALMLGGALLGTSACVDADIDDALGYEGAYSNSEDADKAILGVYSSFMDLSGQMLVLNELRGDLMDITSNSSVALQQINSKSPDSDNPYADPLPYYKVIVNCNDCLDNFDKMLARHDLDQDAYNERYSDVAALRCYIYLQLVSQFGKVPYVTDPVVSVADIEKMQVNTLGIDELVPELIRVMEALPFKEPYEESPLVTTLTGGNTTLDNNVLKMFFVHKKLLLADLYLWNNQYYEAATLYKELMDYCTNEASTNNTYFYKCRNNEVNVALSFYQARFARYMDDNINSFESNWWQMFSDNINATPATYEWIWAISYSVNGGLQNPFIDLFATTDEGGNYQLMPSARCIYDYNDESYPMVNGFPYDTRGDSCTYITKPSGDNVCAKYLYKYDPTVPYEKVGTWWLYRAAMVHLRFAEAMNRYGYPQMALCFINDGICSYYGRDYPSGYTKPTDDPTAPASPCILDLLMPITRNQIAEGHDAQKDSALLYFDTRYCTFNNVSYRGGWRYSFGLRGRASMSNRVASDFSVVSGKTLADCATLQDSICLVEKIIMDEAAVELAHEGNRFPDLVRVAHRMNKEPNDGMNGDQYMNQIMTKKYEKSVSAQPSFASENDWFLKFKN